MRDQAAELRNLVLRSARRPAAGASFAPQLIVLSGGKGGVGTTTLAVNLSVALAQQGKRVVLADGDLCGGDVAPMCGLAERFSVGDVLSARRDIHEVLEPGPAGVQVLPGAWAPAGGVDESPAAQQRLIDQLKSLGRHAETVVLDAGSGAGDTVRRYWQAADRVLLVTTPDSVSIMDAYATIKVMLAGQFSVPINTVVNQSADPELAEEVFRRIEISARRFLGVDVKSVGPVPLAEDVRLAAVAAVPLMIQSPTCPAARAIDQIAAVLLAASSSRQAA